MNNTEKILIISYLEPSRFKTEYFKKKVGEKIESILKETVTESKVVATQTLKLGEKFEGNIKRLVQHVAQDNRQFNESYTYTVK